MTNINVIENRISAVKKYLKILEEYKHYSQKEIEDDINLRGAVERYLYLAVQTGIDLASALVSQGNFRKPTTTAENFHILKEEKIIPAELAEKLVKMVGFRNFIVHDYGKINYDIVYDVLQNRLEDIKKFLEMAERTI